MAKFFGKVGFALETDKGKGVWVDEITEVEYYGDVIRNSRQLSDGDKLNNDISVGNTISIMADEHANQHFFAIRYVEWAGALWSVADIEVRSPRLLLRLGGVYNGPTGGSSGSSRNSS